MTAAAATSAAAAATAPSSTAASPSRGGDHGRGGGRGGGPRKGGSLTARDTDTPGHLLLDKVLMSTGTLAWAVFSVSLLAKISFQAAALALAGLACGAAFVYLTAHSIRLEVSGANSSINLARTSRFVAVSNTIAALAILYGLGRPFIARLYTGHWDRHRQYIPYPDQYQGSIGFHAIAGLLWFLGAIFASATGMKQLQTRVANPYHALVGKALVLVSALVAFSAIFVVVLPVVNESPVTKLLQSTTAIAFVLQIGIGYCAIKGQKKSRRFHLIAMNGALNTASAAAFVRIIMDMSLSGMAASATNCVSIVTDQQNHADLWYRVESTWFLAALAVITAQRAFVFFLGDILWQYFFVIALEIALLVGVVLLHGPSAFAFSVLVGSCEGLV